MANALQRIAASISAAIMFALSGASGLTLLPSLDADWSTFHAKVVNLAALGGGVILLTLATCCLFGIFGALFAPDFLAPTNSQEPADE